MKRASNSQAGFSVIELVIILVVIIGIAVAGWFVYKHDHKKTVAPTVSSTKKVSASDVISDFNTAMQDGNQAKVLSLESVNLKNATQRGTTAIHGGGSSGSGPTLPITNNYYVYCAKYLGQICTYDFSSAALAKASVKTSSYKNPINETGVTETFTINQAINQPNESGSSTTSFSVSVIHDGNSWLVDYVNGLNWNLSL